MSHEVNDQVLERLFEEVDSMSNGEIANELGQPWRVVTIRANARESMIEDLVTQRFENMGGPHG